jgi:hypothetical protein
MNRYACPQLRRIAVYKVLGAIVIFLGVATAQAEVTAHDRLPTHILTCGGSVVTDIGARLEGDTNFSSGTSVFYENGGSQVSYDKVSAIVGSRKGDHVLICLVFIPSNCPAGDDRGKIYTQQICALWNRGLFRILNTAAAVLKRLFVTACEHRRHFCAAFTWMAVTSA